MKFMAHKVMKRVEQEGSCWLSLVSLVFLALVYHLPRNSGRIPVWKKNAQLSRHIHILYNAFNKKTSSPVNVHTQKITVLHIEYKQLCLHLVIVSMFPSEVNQVIRHFKAKVTVISSSSIDYSFTFMRVRTLHNWLSHLVRHQYMAIQCWDISMANCFHFRGCHSASPKLETIALTLPDFWLTFCDIYFQWFTFIKNGW